MVDLLPKNDVVRSEPPREVPADPLSIKREPPGEVPADPLGHEVDGQSQAHARDILSQAQDRTRDSARGQERRCSFPPDPPKKQENPPPSTLPVRRSSSVPPADHGGIRKFQLSNCHICHHLEVMKQTCCNWPGGLSLLPKRGKFIGSNNSPPGRGGYKIP